MVDLDKPEEIRTYLKENMAEGYLSDEEDTEIDEFIDEYRQLLENKREFEEIIRNVYEGRVQ